LLKDLKTISNRVEADEWAISKEEWATVFASVDGNDMKIDTNGRQRVMKRIMKRPNMADPELWEALSRLKEVVQSQVQRDLVSNSHTVFLQSGSVLADMPLADKVRVSQDLHTDVAPQGKRQIFGIIIPLEGPVDLWVSKRCMCTG
jgi:hypothetical protein